MHMHISLLAGMVMHVIMISCTSLPGTLYLSMPVSFVVFFYSRLLSAIPYLVNILRATFDKSSLAIAFPDEGAWKRFGRYFDELPFITCIKVRNGSERVVTIKEGQFNSYFNNNRDNLTSCTSVLNLCVIMCQMSIMTLSIYNLLVNFTMNQVLYS